MASWLGRWRWALALGVAAALLGAWLALSSDGGAPGAVASRTIAVTGSPADAPPAAASASPRSASTRTAAADLLAAPVPVSASASASASGPVPAGFSAGQWQELQAALADHPQREAELRRITAFLQLQQRVQGFAEARQRGASAGELAALARPLQAELPQHLALGELNAAEALRLQAALLEATEPDATAAARALADWRARHVDRPAGEPAHDPREAAFARDQQTALENWQAGGGRDLQALERQLETLRSAHFDARR